MLSQDMSTLKDAHGVTTQQPPFNGKISEDVNLSVQVPLAHCQIYI